MTIMRQLYHGFPTEFLLIGFEGVLHYDKALFTKSSQKYKYQ